MLQQILSGQKTIEGRLGRGKFLKFRAGDTVSIREDIWHNGRIIESIPGRATILIKQVLYFESFEEMLSSIDAEAVTPGVTTIEEAIVRYRQFYSIADEQEHGVVAIFFRLQQSSEAS